jgi:hypothetical protein
MTSRTARFAMALGLLALSPLAVRADPISFGYNFQTPTSVTGDSGNLGVISFATTNPGQGSGSATVAATQLAAVSSAPASNPDTFTGEAYNLTLQVTDTASGQTGTLIFAGQLFGTLTATTTNIKTTFAKATQQIVLGADKYTITVGPLVPPTTPNSGTIGTLDATITAEAQSVTLPSESPEPTGLVLAGIGLTGAALTRRLKNRRQTPAL